MATLALAPDFLRRRRGPGVGGAVEGSGPGAYGDTFVGHQPPYDPPPGMVWVNRGMQYRTSVRSEIVYTEIPRMELQQVQVGTELEKIPYTKRILVDNGHWVTDYRIEKYIRSYRKETYLKSYRQERYVRYYRMKRLPRPFGRGYDLLPVPVYGYRSVPVYGTRWIPVYGHRQVEAGRHWESEWVYEEFTDYKTIEKPVYENRLVQVGVERVPEEVRIEEQVPLGYLWELQPTLKASDPEMPTEDDLLRELRELHKAIGAQRIMLTSAPLRIRQAPGADNPALTIAAEGDMLIWTGEVSSVNGAEWYEVRNCDPARGVVSGWVHSGYLVPLPSESAPPQPENTPDDPDDMERYWLNLLSEEERRLYIELERQKLEALWSEILRLTRPGGGLEKGYSTLVLQEEKALLLQPPEWYLNGGIPDSFSRGNLLTDEIVETLRLILMHPESLSGEVTEHTWQVLASAYHVSSADLKTHVLSQVSWEPESATTVGEYPLTLFVTRRYGHYLLNEPSPDGVNVSQAFLGVPGGEQVEWDGTYQVGLDSSGAQVVYYYVSWDFNGKTYHGWIPNQYLAPQVEHWDPQDG
ncbi:MAG: SH3 domain-containing protein, partial [Anaerolineales bacterium]